MCSNNKYQPYPIASVRGHTDKAQYLCEKFDDVFLMDQVWAVEEDLEGLDQEYRDDHLLRGYVAAWSLGVS